jgi:hypothetical protein
VLSLDLDIVLWKDPTNDAANPWMDPGKGLDLWAPADPGGGLNCGFFHAHYNTQYALSDRVIWHML